MKSQIIQAAKILRQVDIPYLPIEVMQIKRELDSSFPNVCVIANLVSRNPTLLNNFLTIANTCTHSSHLVIDCAKQAINILGLEEVKNHFYSSALMNEMVSNQDEADFFSHTLQLATLAQEVADMVPGVSRSEAFLATLMSEMGGLVLQRYDKNFFKTHYKKYHTYPLSREAVYLKSYQTSLECMSALVCKKWKVDAIISKSILLQNKNLIDTSKPDGEKITRLSAIMNVAKISLCEHDTHCFVTDEMRQLRIKAIGILGEIPTEFYQKAYQVLRERPFKVEVATQTLSQVA